MVLSVTPLTQEEYMNTRKKTAVKTGRVNTTLPNTTTGLKTKFGQTAVADTFVIKSDWFGSYFIERNGYVLTNSRGWTRYFRTRNSARKRISRERRGDFHN
jgi:hypothetical protein